VKKTLMIATALTTGAFSSVAAQPSSSVLQSLPAEVQKEIEDVRAGCREVPTVSSGDDGLILFTVSGAQAVMVSDLELCGLSECDRRVICDNRGSYGVAIYVRSRNTWRKALSTEATGRVFLSTDFNDKFNALVLSIFSGNKDCPTRDIRLRYREGKETYVLPAWKQSCDAIVKWNGTKFNYKPL
jgi:hypothetical protein